ncbi:MAG: glycosyltransferase [Flavobacteriales bacterium]|nr:glycosyltransferase [Flavobacteriales bacterium]
MRLCIVSPNRNAWSETFIANHIAHLPQVVLTLTDGHLPKRDAEGQPLLAPTLLKRMLQRMRKADPTELLVGAIVRRLQHHRVQLVLAEYGPTGEALLDACQRARIPLAVHFHGIDAFHTKLLRDNGNYHRIFQHAVAIVVVSREMERQLLDLGCPRAKLHYNCYGIEVDRFHPADVARTPKRFLTVGRFVDKKAPHLSLLAFHQAWQRDPELRLTMAGEGPLWESTKQLALAQGLGDAVEFPGVITSDQVAERMRQVRGFVQHSVITADNDHEGTPLSILEAMASGLPIISTLHAGIPDVVEHGVNGLLCAERDIQAMATHMNQLADDADLAHRLGLAGRARVEQHHRLEQSLEALSTILRNAKGPD